MTYQSARFTRGLGFALMVAIAIPLGAAEYPSGTTIGAWGLSDNSPLVGCMYERVAPTFGPKALSGMCNSAGASGGSITVQAAADGPSRFNPNDPSQSQLGSLRAKALVTTALRDYPPPGPIPAGYYDATMLNASASAGYRDYLLLGNTKPHRLELYFDLRSTRSLSPLIADASVGMVTIGIQLQPVVLPAPEDYGVYTVGPPYPFGLLFDVRHVYSPGYFTHDGPTRFIDGQLEFSETPHPTLSETSRITLTLGDDFFTEPANNAILIDAYLSGWMYAPSTYIGYPPTADVSNESESDNFLSLVGLRAFDVHGNDTTMTSITGIASLTPVPEVRSWLMILFGLGCVSRAGSRTRGRQDCHSLA